MPSALPSLSQPTPATMRRARTAPETDPFFVPDASPILGPMASSLDGLALLRLVSEIRPDVKAVANELRGTGVTMTALCPGPVASGFQAGADMGASKLVKGKQLMTAERCAQLAVKGMNKGKPVVVTGAMNKMMSMSPKFMPRRMVPGVVRRAQAPKH